MWLAVQMTKLSQLRLVTTMHLSGRRMFVNEVNPLSMVSIVFSSTLVNVSLGKGLLILLFSIHMMKMLLSSVCKSGLVTGKRPEPDRTRTCQDRKLVGPFRTVTAVRSTVQHKSENLKTEQRPVLTSLNRSFKP